MVGPARDRADRGSEEQSARERPRQRIDIAGGPAADRPPSGPSTDRENPVVVEELGEEPRRKAPPLLGVGRPHGGDLRADETLDERAREALLLEPRPKRDVVARL